MENSSALSAAIAFGAGFLTFLSPCILPIIPAYISYITGVSFDELKDGRSAEIRKRAFGHACLFVVGFSMVFIALGASASYLGKLLLVHKTLIARIGGALVILFGLYIMDIFKIPFLSRNKRLDVRVSKGTGIGSVLLGMAFAAAWTPCVGPILGSILVLAGTKESMAEGMWLLAAYSLGIGVPFVLSAVLLNSFLSYSAKLKRHMILVKRVCGLLLVIVGIMLMRGGIYF